MKNYPTPWHITTPYGKDIIKESFGKRTITTNREHTPGLASRHSPDPKRYKGRKIRKLKGKPVTVR